jgi:hypothetical protein
MRRSQTLKRAGNWRDEHTLYSGGIAIPPDSEQIADLIEDVRSEALVDAARAVDIALVEAGALEGSSIHSAMSAARRAIMMLREEK